MSSMITRVTRAHHSFTKAKMFRSFSLSRCRLRRRLFRYQWRGTTGPHLRASRGRQRFGLHFIGKYLLCWCVPAKLFSVVVTRGFSKLRALNRIRTHGWVVRRSVLTRVHRRWDRRRMATTEFRRRCRSIHCVAVQVSVIDTLTSTRWDRVRSVDVVATFEFWWFTMTQA